MDITEPDALVSDATFVVKVDDNKDKDIINNDDDELVKNTTIFVEDNEHIIINNNNNNDEPNLIIVDEKIELIPPILRPHEPSIVLKFHPAEIYFPGFINERILTKCHSSSFTYNDVVYIKKEYQFIYDENGAIGCFYQCCPRSGCLGYHKDDDERLIILTDAENVKKHVYFNAHGRGQGMWLPYDDCLKNEDGDLVVYVARASHAFYPRPETYVRIFGFANDLCEDGGKTIEIEILGEFDTPINPPQTSITPTERFFLPFIVNRLENRV